MAQGTRERTAGRPPTPRDRSPREQETEGLWWEMSHSFVFMCANNFIECVYGLSNVACIGTGTYFGSLGHSESST